MTAPAQATVRIGRITLRRRSARIAARLVAGAVLVLVAWVSPPWREWPMWLSAAGWIGFSIYWGVAARDAAAARSAESSRSRGVHLLLANAGELLLFVPVPGLRHDFLPTSPAWVPLGLAVQASAVALAVWARRHLGRNWSARIEIKERPELVRTGPYRLLRHPIYTAVLGMCVGTALVDGKTHALVGVALVLVAYWRKIRLEEANLRVAFGPAYDEYRRRTWGMIPGVF